MGRLSKPLLSGSIRLLTRVPGQRPGKVPANIGRTCHRSPRRATRRIGTERQTGTGNVGDGQVFFNWKTGFQAASARARRQFGQRASIPDRKYYRRAHRRPQGSRFSLFTPHLKEHVKGFYQKWPLPQQGSIRRRSASLGQPEKSCSISGRGIPSILQGTGWM